MRKLQKMIAWMLILCSVIAGMGAVHAQDAAESVVISVEKFTIGQGFVRQPTRITLQQGDTAATVLVRLLGEGNYRHTGALEDGSFNLTGVYDPSGEPAEVPSYICDKAGVTAEQLVSQGRAQADWLGEMDYYSQAGWMYLVNNEFPDVSAANYRPKGGDVIRFAFSVAGWGMDLGANYSGDLADSWVEPANKDALLTLAADVGAREDRESLMQNPEFTSVWDSSMNVLGDMEASQEEVGTALEALHAALEAASQTGHGAVFADMDGHWAEDVVGKAAQEHIMLGTDDALFEPERDITRAEFAAVLCRTLGLEQMATQEFADVGDTWYNGYIGSAAHNGIMRGKGEASFAPLSPVTREEAAVALMASAKLAKGETAVMEPERMESLLSRYSDAEFLSLWSREAVAFCSELGLLAGTGSAFEPLAPVSRAQAAVMAVRLLDFI